MPSVSIILCTRNRASDLGETLAALDRVRLPAGWPGQIVMVDNGSTDETADVIAAAKSERFALRSLHVAQPGKSYALNAGIAAASGDYLVFTDDDVVPAEDWIEQLTAPLLSGEADATGGRIELAPSLQRGWLTPDLARWLAATGERPIEFELIGANMALRREVFEKVRGFDEALAPGAIGLGEDTLLTWQLRAAGFRLRYVPAAIVVHHPSASRLRRASWLRMAQSHGRKDAYLRYHWLHDDLRAPRLRRFALHCKLALRRIVQPPVAPEAESCARWEMSYIGDIAMCMQFCLEKKRARKYPGPQERKENARRDG